MTVLKSTLKIALIITLSLICTISLFSCNTPSSSTSDTSSLDGEDSTASNGNTDNTLTVVGGENAYVVVRPEMLSAVYEKEGAILINNALKAATGTNYKMTTDYKTNPVSNYEICVGELLNRDYTVNTDELNYDEFLVTVCGTRIIIIGCTSLGTQKGAEWFVKEYLNVEEGSLKELKIPANLNYVGKFELSDQIRIMTQNLLATDTEYAGYVKDPAWADRITVDLSQHTLAKRQPKILKLIETYAPDSLGVQECSSSWCKYFDNNLASIGYERVGASKNQKIGIIYNTKTLKLIEKGSIYLSENPNSLKISKLWCSEGNPEGITERLAMYCVFEVINTGERYIHFNTHIDTRKNDIIQEKQTEVIIDYVNDIVDKFDGLPAVLTGDFNYNTGSAEYRLLLDSGLLAAKKESTVSTGDGSFNKFIGSSYHSSPIDHIIGNDKFNYYEYHVIYDMDGEYFLSDHYAVLADVAFKR